MFDGAKSQQESRALIIEHLEHDEPCVLTIFYISPSHSKPLKVSRLDFMFCDGCLCHQMSACTDVDCENRVLHAYPCVDFQARAARLLRRSEPHSVCVNKCNRDFDSWLVLRRQIRLLQYQSFSSTQTQETPADLFMV